MATADETSTSHQSIPQQVSSGGSIPVTWVLGFTTFVVIAGLGVLWDDIRDLDQRLGGVEQQLVRIETILNERLPKPTP